MLPNGGDQSFIEDLMRATPEREPGRFASWIAPPRVGIDNKPGDFEYVRLA
jgi:benzoyl-CoA 2,3-dioxygenase component B